MADPQYVNLTAPPDAQLAEIQRRQKYAELLAQQGAEPIDVQSVNGIPTPISPFQGLAKVFQSGMGAYLSGQATKDKTALDKANAEKLSNALANYNNRSDVGTVDTTGIAGAGDSFPITGQVGSAPTKSDSMRRAAAMLDMGESGKTIGTELLKQSIEPEKLYTLNRGDTLQTAAGDVRGQGQPVPPPQGSFQEKAYTDYVTRTLAAGGTPLPAEKWVVANRPPAAAKPPKSYIVTTANGHDDIMTQEQIAALHAKGIFPKIRAPNFLQDLLVGGQQPQQPASGAWGAAVPDDVGQ